MKVLKISLALLACLSTSKVSSQVFLTEGFEDGRIGLITQGWTEEFVSGADEPWRFRNGGHSPNDSNWDVPAEQVDITRNPDGAYEGILNAIFFKQNPSNERTKLITPPMNLQGATAVELRFYHCQMPWNFEGSLGWDQLRVYYRTSEEAPWQLLHEYLDKIYEWKEQILYLPDLSETYYVAFEGAARWGYGTCIDNITIRETGSQPMHIGDIDFQQPFPSHVPSGSPDLPVLRVDFNVFGNTDSVVLDYIHVNSLNTDDSDIRPGGVKLYTTSNQIFDTIHPLGTPTSFSSGVASFTSLGHTLPAGHSYLWLTFDLEMGAGHDDVLDVMVAANGISANGTAYPETDQSPEGFIRIYETRYYQGFEGTHNWTLGGEFEVATPAGRGGSPGNPDPVGAYRGTRALGTDLSGLGSFPGNYEPGLTDATANTAVSPNINVLYYKNLNLFYQRYANIEFADSAYAQVSLDNGSSWKTFWNKGDAHLTDYEWLQEQISIPNQYSRSDQLRLRFKLGPTDGSGNYSGWNIDELFLTGEFISKDVGISEWIYPLSGSGHTSSDSVTVRVNNFGGAEITDPVPVAYSFNGGLTWTINQLTEHIPVGGSVVFTFPTRADLSEPGMRSNVLAKTILPGDQFTLNDRISTEINIVPTYTPTYSENFDAGDGYWMATGIDLWEYGTPGGTTIDHASSGTKSWVTGLSSTYGNEISQKAQIIFDDNFETDKGWSFSGEFDWAQPDYAYPPFFANSPQKCIGIDLLGRGANPYEYENGIASANANTATSPVLDVTHYCNLKLSIASWISINDGDSIRLEVSPDNGSTWHTLWKNTQGEIMELGFDYVEYDIPDSFTYTDEFLLRFSLFHTSASGPVAQGWSIDDVQITGDLVESNPAYLSSPSFDLSGLTAPVIIAKTWVDTEEGTDGATLEYSLDDGHNWNAVTNTSGYDEYWNWYSGDPVSALGRDGWSGQSEGWIPVTHLLPSAVQNQLNVQFRFRFAADKVDNAYDGIAIDDIRIFDAPADVDMIEILDPVSACELSPIQTFTLRMQNAGLSALQPGDSLRFAYSVDRSGDLQSAEETLVLDQSWPAGQTRDIPLSAEFDFSKSGRYTAQVCFLSDEPYFYKAAAADTVVRTIDVNKPSVELGADISTAQPDTVVLKAFSGTPGQTYLWQDSSTDSVFHVSTDGTYHVRVTNTLGCIARDTVQVLQLVKDVGVSVYLGPASGCELADALLLEITVENLGTDTVQQGESIYVGGMINESVPFEDIVVLSDPFFPGETFNHTYTGTFDFSSPGDYQMKLYTRMTGDMEAGNDTLYHTLQTFGYPDAGLGPDTVVSASEYLLIPAPGYYSYLWQDGSTGETFLVDQSGIGQYFVVVSDEHQCTSSDTVIVTLEVLDLELEQLLSPATSCELSEYITVSARVRNAGDQSIPSGATVTFGYSIDGGTAVLEDKTLEQTLLPGHTFDFSFPAAEHVITGQWYDFTVFVDYPDDSKSWNDTVITSVGIFEAPPLDLGPEYQEVVGFEHELDAGAGYISYKWQDGSTEQTYTITELGNRAYSVTVTDANGCTAYDEVNINLVVPDVGLLELVHPKTTCHLEDQEHVRLAVKNFGSNDIPSSAEITVAYSINGASEISEVLTLEDDFGSGEVIEYTFSHTEDFSQPGSYEIMAYTSYESDLVPSNDFILTSVDHFGSPEVDLGIGEDTILVYSPITLSVTPGYPSYEWQDGSDGTTFEILQPSAAWYRVSVTGDNGCVTKDSVYVIYDKPDLALTRMVAPVSSCELTDQTVVSLEIMNNGYDRISTADTIILSYNVDFGSSVIEHFHLDPELPAHESRVLSFATEYDFSAKRTYQVQGSLIYSKEKDYSNNQVSGTVVHWEEPEVEIGNGQDTLVAELPVTLDAGPGFESYLWQDQSAASTLQANIPGLFWVEVTDDHGCSGFDSVVVSSITSVISGKLPSGQVRIYPNPVEDILFVKLNLEVREKVILELFSITRSLLYRQDLNRARVTEAQISVQDLAPGTYFLRITADGSPHMFMVIVQ
jgi:hypothetical protein